jgi:hypothetical protein
VAEALAQAGDLEGARGAARQALEAAEKIRNEMSKAQALSVVAWALAQAGDREGLRGALAAAEEIGDDESEVRALSGVAEALAGDREGREVFRRAMLTARFASRESVFYALNTCATLLADLDKGKTLWQITEKIVEVDSWWSN